MEKELEQSDANCLRIVFFGPESTGKTTLARELAKEHDTEWAPEFMRTYLQEKWDSKKEKCQIKDLLPIARGQMLSENKKAELANKYLFCDTNLLELKVYSEYYYDGFCPTEIKKYAIKSHYDLCFLTDIDVPWVFDNLRDRPANRQEMFRIFELELINNEIPYQVLSGSLDERLGQVKSAMERLKNSMNAK